MRPRKSTQRRSEPSFFLMNKTGAPCREIDFEVVKTMRRENFSFSFAENVGKFVILGKDIGEIRSFCKFYRVGLNVQRTKTEFEIVGARKF